MQLGKTGGMVPFGALVSQAPIGDNGRLKVAWASDAVKN